MSAKKKAMASVERDPSDLREIEGLGPKSEEALAKLGIGNCAELARYLRRHSAQELSDRLAHQGVKVAAKKIENEGWLGQANELSARATTKPAKQSQEEAGTAEMQEEADQPAGSAVEVPFDVRFRREDRRWTVITYDERDRGPTKIHGIDPAEWANWILEQMRWKPELEFPPTVQWTGPTSEIEIVRLEGKVSAAELFKTLAADVNFGVSGSRAEALTEAGTSVWIYAHAHDLDSQTTNLVASARVELEAERYTYKKRLEFPILELGRYELRTLVVIPPPVRAMALHRGRAFKVGPRRQT